MSEMTDSGITITITEALEPDSSDNKDCGKVNNEVTNNTSVTTSLSTETIELYTNHLSVPSRTVSIDCIQDIHKDHKIDRSGSRGSIPSITSFLDDVMTPKRVTKVIKFRLMATLTITIFTVVLLFLFPIVFYNINPPTTELYSFDGVALGNVDFETCSADTLGFEADILIKQCNITDDDCDLNSTAIVGLQSVYTVGLLNSQCVTNDTLSFFCNATLLLCNGNSSSVDLAEECEEVRDNKCASEWRIVESFYNRSVPDCMSYIEDENLTFSQAPRLPCPSEFDHICGSTCLPVCGEYSVFMNYKLRHALFIIIIVFGIVGLIGGIITLIACYYNRHKLCQFPQIYVLYNTIVWELFGCLELLPVITNMAGLSLVCSDHSYLVSISRPSDYCQLQGFLLMFVHSCFVGFWLFHLLHLFLSVCFPFKMKTLLKSPSFRIKVHIVEVLIVLLFALLSPIFTITLSFYRDNGWFCAPQSNDVVFYGVLLPQVLMFLIGLVLLFLSLWILRRNHHLKSNNIAFSKVFCLGFSVPEIKLFLLFCYYMLTMLIYFITVVAHLLATDTLTASTNKYLVCSAGGDREQCEEHRERAEASLIGAISLTMLIVILYSLVNLSHLVYVIHFPTVKKTIQKLYKS